MSNKLNNVYNTPIKIIYGVKNKYNKRQYYQYIFLGNIEKNIKSIIEKFKDISLIDALDIIKKDELELLEDKYGKEWYKFFWNKYHIKNTFNPENKKFLENKNKFIKDWFNERIKDKKTISSSKTYGIHIKHKNISSLIMKNKNLDYDDINSEGDNYKSGQNIQLGGDDEIDYETLYGDIDSDDSDETEEDKDIQDIETEDLNYSSDEEITNDSFSDINIEDKENKEIDETSKDIDIDNNNEDNKNDINKLSKITDFEKIKNSMIDLSTDKDDNIYDDELKNNIQKIYIYDEYINIDDTFKNIKLKIFSKIKNHSKYGDYNYLMPSRQYLWAEKFYDEKKKEEIMLGIKWLEHINLLNVETCPNSNIKVYSELRNPINILSERLALTINQIKLEKLDNDILFDYIDYIDNYEIFMIDIYNELGYNNSYNEKEYENLTKTFFKIYFPYISLADYKHIINYLNNNDDLERKSIQKFYDNNIVNIVLNNQIEKIVCDTNKYKNINIISDENLIQIEIHVNLEVSNSKKINKLNFFNIFNNFNLNDKYIFIQYTKNNGNMIFKLNENVINEKVKDNDNYSRIVNWFNNNKYGLTFKIDAIKDKFPLSVNINILGQLKYKLHFKEEDNVNINDINKYNYIIKDLITEINKYSNIKFNIPNDEDFKINFMTLFEKFNIKNNKYINHNDLSKFSKLFYPYVALVIDPKKRTSTTKQSEEIVSKFGTYLRYKRISKYEDVNKIEDRIKYYLKNYDTTAQQIIDVIEKQFNIIHEKAVYYFNNVIEKYPKITQYKKKTKYINENIKYKTSGIEVSIQGKKQENYKIRLSGIRNVEQLILINNIINTILYLYVEIYLNKNDKYDYVKNILNSIRNIAERRYLVSNFVDYSNEPSNIKKYEKYDKLRIGYSATDNILSYSRACQNTKEKPRGPIQYNNINDVLNDGYKLNKAQGWYEKQFKVNGKMKTLKLVKMKRTGESDDSNTDIYYTCNPIKNKDFMYIGFLTKSKNPYGELMPCCFLKDQSESNNIMKKNIFDIGIGKKVNKNEIKDTNINEQVYILNDTNILTDGKLSLLPPILDYFINKLNDKKMKIQNFLINTDGYYLKMGTIDNTFISAVSKCYDLTYNDIMLNIKKSLLNNKNAKLIFNALNNGEIKLKYKTINNYLKYLETNNFSFNNIKHILTIPGVIDDNGLNIILFSKDVNLNNEIYSSFKFNVKINLINNEEKYDETKNTIIIYNDKNAYYPIVHIFKSDDKNKNKKIIYTKIFNNNDDIINIIKPYYEKLFNNLTENIIKDYIIFSAKDLYKIITNKNNKNYNISKQYVDIKNKVKYLILNDKYLLPVKSSGSLYNIPIIDNYDDYILNYKDTIKIFDELKNNLDLDLTVNKIIYSEKKNDKFKINGLIVNNLYVPIKEELINKSNDYELIKMTSYKNIDENIMNKIYYSEKKHLKGESPDESVKYSKKKENIDEKIDERIKLMNYHKYYNESYQLFRYHLSNYLTSTNKKEILNILDNDNLNDKEKLKELKEKIYEIINNKDLIDIYNELIDDNNKIKYNKDSNKQFVYIFDNEEILNLDNYKINNNRNVKSCINSPHYTFTSKNDNKICMFSLSKKMAVIFINKVITELLNNGIQMKELLKLDGYEVSEIVNEKFYDEKDNQKILMKTNNDASNPFITYYNELNDVKQEYVKNKKDNKKQQKIYDTQEKFKEIIFNDKIKQEIYKDNNTILRAYCNSLNWLYNKDEDNYTRNIKYYSIKQNEILKYIKSKIVNYVVDKKNKIDDIINDDYDFIINLMSDTNKIKDNVYDYLLILSKIIDIPIIIYDQFEKIDFIITDGKKITSDNLNDFKVNKKKSINIQISKDIIYSIYYL